MANAGSIVLGVLGWHSAVVFALWLVVGTVSAWGRRRGVAWAIGALATLPAWYELLRWHPGAALVRPGSLDPNVLWHGAVLPLLGCGIGGLVAEAVSPDAQAGRRRRDAVRRAGVEVSRIHDDARRLRQRAAAEPAAGEGDATATAAVLDAGAASMEQRLWRPSARPPRRE